MNKTELNMDVINKVIAFKMLEILRNNGIIDDSKYVNIERKRKQYGESIKTQNKLYRRSMGVNTDRTQRRQVVFYGRVSSDDE